MKSAYKIILLLICCDLTAYSQKKYLFHPAEISDSVKIMAISYSPNVKTNFYINDPLIVKQFMENVTYGDTVKSPIIDSYWTIIKLIKNKKTIDSWGYWPTGSNIQKQNQCYDFDLTQLRSYMSNYYITYSKNEKSFITVEEYKSYIDTILNEKNIINYEPEFSQYEGWFYVTVQYTSEINTVSKAIQKIKKEMNSEPEMLIGYSGDVYNIENKNKLYRLKVQSSYNQFNEFKPIESIKHDWNPYPYKVKVKTFEINK